jgi:hypothetical protein
MGLDANLYKRREGGKREEITYWRKNGSLHRFMESVYRAQGGTESFNCIELDLSKDDLSAAIREARELRWMGWTKDVKILRQAKGLIDEGYTVSYDSWW